MKKLLIVTLALALSGCGALAPVPPTAAPPPTAQVIIQTVMVVATNPPTTVPSDTPAPTQTPAVVVVTATGGSNTVAATSPANTAAAAGAATATATLPADAGGNLFTNMTRSGSFFSLRCLPQDLTFGVSTSNLYVVEVDLFYRIEDLTTQPASLSEWKNVGKMVSDKNGNFTVDLNTSQLSPDLRAPAKAWFDYQFVGISKTGDAVGRSGKISQQILYLKDCP